MRIVYLRAALILLSTFTLALFPLLAISGGSSECRPPHNQCGHSDGDTDHGDNGSNSSIGDVTGGIGTGGSVGSVEVSAETEVSAEAVADSSSESSAESTSNAAGGSVGDITINNGDIIPANTTHSSKIKLENTPDMVTFSPGSGDACKAHIGASLAIPGLGTGITIPLPGVECRKLKYYDRMISAGQYQTAEIMFCALKEVRKEFREMNLDCIDTLTIYVEPVPVTEVPVEKAAPEVFSASSMVANLTEEQYEALKSEIAENDAMQHEVNAAQMEQLQVQQALLKDQEDELERLRREAQALRAAEEARKMAEIESRAKFAKRLAAKEPQGE